MMLASHFGQIMVSGRRGQIAGKIPNGIHCINHSPQNRPTAKHSGLQLLKTVGQNPFSDI
jgi:hypothetical protein